jgi:hypothetical protein
MARMGHASPRAALIYQHATSERDRLIADPVSKQIDQARGTGRKRGTKRKRPASDTGEAVSGT